MKLVIGIISLLLLLSGGASQAQDFRQFSNFGQYSAAAQNLQVYTYRSEFTPEKTSILETTKISIGTIYKSHHFNNEDYNETHNGIYLNVASWSVGTYENSANKQSVFVTYNPELYQSKSLQVNLVAGLADGYEGWQYAQGDYMAVIGVSAMWMNLKAMVSPEVIAFGVELPLN